MRIGKLTRQRITFQRKVVVKGKFNDQKEEWVDDFSVAAAFQPVGSDEFHVAWKRYAESTARFMIRFRSDINPATHRIVMTMDWASPALNSIWDIKPPIAVAGRPFEIYIEATEVKGQAQP